MNRREDSSDPSSDATIGAPTSSPVTKSGGTNRFEILEKLGEGGFGIVHLAYDNVLKRKVALKQPKSEHIGSSTATGFLEEARRTTSRNYQGIVTVHDVIDSDSNLGSGYIVLEYYPNGDLRQFASIAKLGAKEIADLIANVASTVQKLHADGMTHADLKPTNILITENGEPVLADFGLAFTDDSFSRVRGTTFGSKAYMAPELLSEGFSSKAQSQKADIWSLGIILYELLTESRPTKTQEDRVKLLEKLASDRTVGPRDDNENVPEELDEICRKCLQLKPANRPLANDLVVALAKFAGTGTTLRPKPRWVHLVLVTLALALAFCLCLKSAKKEINSAVSTVLNDQSKTFWEGDNTNAGEAVGEKPASTYEALLLRQNPNLVEHIKGFSGPDSKILLVCAPGGYGKTDMMQLALSPLFEKRPTAKFEPKDYAKSEMQDLVLRTKTVNKLPMLNDAAIKELLFDLREETEDGSVVQLDGIDEIHQDAFIKLLDGLRNGRDLFKAKGLDFILYVRAEVVALGYQDDVDDDFFAGVDYVILNPQRVTASTLRLRVRNYLDYRAKKAGGNGTVVGTNDKTKVDQVTEEMLALIKKYDFLIETLRIGMLNGELIYACSNRNANRIGDSRREIKKQVQTGALDRAKSKQKHRRDYSNEDYWEALTTIAVNRIPDKEGFFTLPDTMEFENGERFIPFNVLQRSGLISMKYIEKNPMFRFEPIWTHSLLAEEAGDWWVPPRILPVSVTFLVFFLIFEAVYWRWSRHGRGKR